MFFKVKSKIKTGVIELGRDVECFSLSLLCLLTALSALTYTTHVLTLTTPDHWCLDAHVWALHQQLPLSLEDTKKFSLPPRHYTRGSDVTFSQCTRYRGDLIGSYIGWVSAKKPVFYTPEHNATILCDQGWLYNSTGYSSTISTKNNWVCDDRWIVTAVHVIFWFNAALGAIIVATLNRSGRRYLLLCAVSSSVLGSTLMVATSTLLWVIVSRTLLGFSYLTVRIIPLMFALEMNKREHHGFVLTLVVVITTVFTGVVNGIMRLFHEWQYLDIIGTVIGLFSFILTCSYVVKHPAWEMKRGLDVSRDFQALMWNGNDFQVNQEKQIFEREKYGNDEDLLLPSYTTSHFSRVPAYLVWLFCSFGYFFIQLSSLSLLGDSVNLAPTLESQWYSTLMEVPCWILPLLLQNHTRCQRVLVNTALALASLAGFIVAFTPPEHAAAKICASLVARIVLTSSFYTEMQHQLEISQDGNLEDQFKEFSFGAGIGGFVVATTPVTVYLNTFDSRLPMCLLGLVSSVLPLGVLLRLAWRTVRRPRDARHVTSRDVRHVTLRDA